MSLSSYTVSLFKEKQNFIAIPVFPSRFFRHSCIYVNAKSGIKEPKDLIGRKIGNPEYQMTAPVWIRGILQDEYGVTVDTQTVLPGRRGEPVHRPRSSSSSLPPRIKVAPIGEGQTARGDAARWRHRRALHRAHALDVQGRRAGPVRRLFENYMEVEQAYYRKTRMFPIMHTVAIRREVYEQYPWVAMNLYKAFVQAQRECYEDLYVTAALKTSLPWLTKHVEDARALMGDDFWPYGFAPNRETLATFLRYHHEQGLSKRLLKPEELFAPRRSKAFVI
jgi:4,5-dihydroxyphthalate decarboxylase